ncbi:hypothetical protein HDF16_003437 [Granulicella aggregans]|uniref:Uncharacterized protein n=1 Tax=Granulicella aggregans TaxID=474949 RepID=A0A7W7ZFG0_9BACT|nr:hypothetical protein [Granulicella aggregans]
MDLQMQPGKTRHSRQANCNMKPPVVLKTNCCRVERMPGMASSGKSSEGGRGIVNGWIP